MHPATISARARTNNSGVCAKSAMRTTPSIDPHTVPTTRYKPFESTMPADGCATIQTVSHAHTKTAAKSKSHKAASSAPQSIGKFGDWQAATHTEAGQTICYAFARPDASDPALPGRGDVVFTVTERAKLRDTVALSAGFVYPANAQVSVTVGSPSFPFYTAGRSAFARDGAALIAAFDKGSDAVVSSPAPKGKTVTDHFSLTGFSAAMTAVLAACPDRA